MRTLKLSPKVWQPVALLIVGFAANWIASGEFDRTELAQLCSAVAVALMGYAARPGLVDPNIGPASDDLLGDEMKVKIRKTRAR